MLSYSINTFLCVLFIMKMVNRYKNLNDMKSEKRYMYMYLY